MQDPIIVYGANDCPDTQRTTRQLQSLGIPYEYVNVDQDRDAQQQVVEWNGGKRITPTVLLPTGNVTTGETRMSAPSDEELRSTLNERGWIRNAQQPNTTPDYRSGGQTEVE